MLNVVPLIEDFGLAKTVILDMFSGLSSNGSCFPSMFFNWRSVSFSFSAMLFQWNANEFETQVVQVVPRAIIIRLLRFQRRTKTSAHKNKNGHQ